MRVELKYGLITGIVGLVTNVCVSTVLGICGPVTALLAGAIGAFFAVREGISATRQDAMRMGALTGLIAGGFVLVGQIFGGVLSLSIAQGLGLTLQTGAVPQSGEGFTELLSYWVGGIGFGLCLGFLNVVISALAGAGVGYFTTPVRD